VHGPQSRLALDVGVLAAHFHVDRARTSLGARELQFALRLALERDACRCRTAALGSAAVAATQVREQLELGFLADHILGTGHRNARLVELRNQFVDRYLQYRRKLRNCHLTHAYLPQSIAR